MMADEPTRQKQPGIPDTPQLNTPPAGIPILPVEKSLYFNGFAIAVGAGDIVLTLLRNGVPTQTLNASFTVSKTLGAAIVASIQKLEEVTNHEIMTVQDVTEATSKLGAANEPH
jgi:hypothetical protein